MAGVLFVVMPFGGLEAGISSIQPGIESLSGAMLTLINKGASPLQNIQLLKWCQETRMFQLWNIIYGMPGEQAEDYHELYRFAADTTHLTPPSAAGRFAFIASAPTTSAPTSSGSSTARATSRPGRAR
jgi:hypothetical protein